MKLILIRGLPGSGKTTFAHTLTDHIFEADDYFLNSEGIYNYDATKIKEAHLSCQYKVVGAMMLKTPIIAVSNTFTRRWMLNIYYGYAISFGYEVTEITMSGGLHGNTHNVPEETIERMRNEWER